jgi:hypothetical protein
VYELEWRRAGGLETLPPPQPDAAGNSERDD